MRRRSWILSLVALLALASLAEGAEGAEGAKSFTVQPRQRIETAAGSGRYHVVTTRESWEPRGTAIIVCDMWDSHHSVNAVRRVVELAPRMNQVLETARAAGALIIHAPSSCLASYADHPARARAQRAPQSANVPADIGQWCRHIPEEDRGRYPVDQTNGGEDDDPGELKQWGALLASQGRNPRAPWKAQVDLLRIDERDAISDSGVEIWNLLEHEKIQNVILLGVHTNMCVLGRPFGLRQLAKNGRHVVLMRDMTDTMYDPNCWPYVSHFSGTDLIVEHIEKFVCPTITSVDLLGGQEFRFSQDRRPHVVVLCAEDEYRTEESLPPFAAEHLQRDFRVSFVFGSEQTRNDLPGWRLIDEADVLLVSVRRRTFPEEQLAAVRRHVAAGKGVVGIRTASHSFSPSKGKALAEGEATWDDFDPVVLGGRYRGHHGNEFQPAVTHAPEAAGDPLLSGVDLTGFTSHGSLYMVAPLEPGTHVLLTGTISGQPTEPLAWTRVRRDGGRTFYTSLGHIDDFQKVDFRRLLTNAVYWSAGRPIPAELPRSGDKQLAGN